MPSRDQEHTILTHVANGEVRHVQVGGDSRRAWYACGRDAHYLIPAWFQPAEDLYERGLFALGHGVVTDAGLIVRRVTLTPAGLRVLNGRGNAA